MLYLYLDESGDLGFDFVTKKPSKFFSVGILLFKDERTKKKIDKLVKRTLRKKLNPKSKRKRFVPELKGSSTTIKIKKYFYRLIKDVNFSLYFITLNKRRVYPELAKDKSRVYNFISRLLLDSIDYGKNGRRIKLIIDKSKSKPEITNFNKYIRRQLEAEIDPKTPLEIVHEDSCADHCLNVIDLFVWGVFRKYEKRDFEWYDVFKEKIRYEDVYLP